MGKEATDDRKLVRQAQQGNAAAIDLLIRRNTPAIWRVVHEIDRRGFGRSSTTLEDLAQEGSLAFLKCIHRYDPDSEASLWTYAQDRVRGAMIDEIRKHDWLIRKPRSIQRQIIEALALFETAGESGDRRKPVELMVEEMDVTKDEAYVILSMMSHINSFLDFAHEDGTSGFLYDYYQCEYENEKFNTFLKKALNALTTREQKVFLERTGLETGIPRKNVDIAKDIGVSEGRITQHYWNAVRVMKQKYINYKRENP